MRRTRSDVLDIRFASFSIGSPSSKVRIGPGRAILGHPQKSFDGGVPLFDRCRERGLAGADTICCIVGVQIANLALSFDRPQMAAGAFSMRSRPANLNPLAPKLRRIVRLRLRLLLDPDPQGIQSGAGKLILRNPMSPPGARANNTGPEHSSSGLKSRMP
jgi:hypothetical protein